MSGGVPFWKASYNLRCFACSLGCTDSLKLPNVFLKSCSSIFLNQATSQLSCFRTSADFLMRSSFSSPIKSEQLKFQVTSTKAYLDISISTDFSNISNSQPLSVAVGQSKNRWASNLPGLSTAGSMRSGRELAATMYTPEVEDTPSKQHRNWFTILSLTPVLFALLFGTIDSNSSKKMMLGLTLMAFQKMSRTAASLPPIYLLRMSDPFTLKYFILNSSFKEEPRAVLPLPVLPYKSTPLGNLMGTDLKSAPYLIGFSIRLFIVFLAYCSPASLPKSNFSELFFVCGCDSWMACLEYVAKGKDQVPSAILIRSDSLIDQTYTPDLTFRTGVSSYFLMTYIARKAFYRSSQVGFLKLTTVSICGNQSSRVASLLAVAITLLPQMDRYWLIFLAISLPITFSFRLCWSLSQTFAQRASTSSKQSTSQGEWLMTQCRQDEMIWKVS